MRKLQENQDSMEPRSARSKNKVGKVAPSIKVAAISKPARQAAFKVKCIGLSSQEAVAHARLIPDASPSNFKVVRIAG